MPHILTTQLLYSFLIGGSFIALLTILAERSSGKIAGIILMFPSTIALGFFFLGITLSPEQVAETIPRTIIPLSLLSLSAAIYILIAKKTEKITDEKSLQIIVTTFTSIIIWLTIALPFVFIKIDNLIIGVFGYIIITLLAHKLLSQGEKQQALPKPKGTIKTLLTRALFLGAIISLVVFLGKTLGAFWGSIFTMFPAATFSALIIYHLKYPAKKLYVFMRKVPVGTISLLTYTLMVMLIFPAYGVIIGSIGAYLTSLICSLLLLKIFK